MKEQQLESGLWLAEEEQAPPPTPPEPIRCVVCLAESLEVNWGFGVTGDGFLRETPTCQHGSFWVCRGCRPTQCPLCGCEELLC